MMIIQDRALLSMQIQTARQTPISGSICGAGRHGGAPDQHCGSWSVLQVLDGRRSYQMLRKDTTRKKSRQACGMVSPSGLRGALAEFIARTP